MKREESKERKGKELTALEELEDMGFEILNKGIDDKYHVRKISIDVQFYEDGSWCVDSCIAPGQNATLGSGRDLRNILPILKYCRNVFLKALKEGLK